MHSKRLTVLLPLLVVVTMLASLITPSPVLAAGEPPPPPGEKSPKPSPARDKPAPPASPVGASYTTEVPQAAPAAGPDGGAAVSPLALSVETIARAGAVLIGPSGNPMSLAAQDTVNALLTVGDVYFKGSGGSECSGGWCDYDTIANALGAFSARSGSGTIYARGELVEPGAVDVDGTTFNLGKLTGLAWDGNNDYSPWISGGPLTIANMVKGFSVDGFNISQGIYAHDNAGTLRLRNLYVTNPTGIGISITNHKGIIDLLKVTVSNAGYDGAFLDNTSGTGDITINNSSFNENYNYGVFANTNGSILVNRVESNHNLHGDGVNLNMQKGAEVNDSRFNSNGYNGFRSGLVISGRGAVSLENIEAVDDANRGIAVDTTNDITINDVFLAGNWLLGLDASTSGGNITLNNVQTEANTSGVLLDNSKSVTVKTVMVKNSAFNNSTGGRGLEVLSRGNITLNHIDARSNADDGVSIDNAIFDEISQTYTGSGSVTILNTMGPNRFIDNNDRAANIQSKGAILLKGVFASHNAVGIRVDGCLQDPNEPYNCLGKGNLSLSEVQVETSLYGYGLNAKTGGAISLDNSHFIANLFGVVLNNGSASANKPVMVTNSSFNYTSDPTSVGLEVYSRGSITLNHVQANSNQGMVIYSAMGTYVSGILLENCMYNDAPMACTGSGSVRVLSSLGRSETSGNVQGYGLFIFSNGEVTISRFSSTSNGGGAYLDNHSGTARLTITNSTFSDNTGTQGGLQAYSDGAITLNGVKVSQNSGGSGAWLLNNSGLTTTDAITIDKSHFDYNKDYGLLVVAKGKLTLNNVTANHNTSAAGLGANLYSIYSSVTIQDTLGPNQFSFNANHGLDVLADNGSISIRGVMASSNGSIGIYLNNINSTTPKTISALKITSEHNLGMGLKIYSRGSITLNAVKANFNSGGYGVYINNCNGIPCKDSGNVSFLSTLGHNSMSSNKHVGLWIESGGNVLVNDITASNNFMNPFGVSGVWIYNGFSLGKTVTVNRGVFNYNQGDGLNIASSGVITVNNISASYNTTAFGNGISLWNAQMSGSPGINILSTSGNNLFNGNARTGLYVRSDGNIVLSKVSASDNGAAGLSYGAKYDGVDLYTSGTSLISITCGVFNHNGYYGLRVTMGTGVLRFKGVTARGNFGPADFELNGKTPVISGTVCGY